MNTFTSNTLADDSTKTPVFMNNQEAANIIQALIDSINPLSDEPLPNNSLYLNSDIQ